MNVNKVIAKMIKRTKETFRSLRSLLTVIKLRTSFAVGFKKPLKLRAFNFKSFLKTNKVKAYSQQKINQRLAASPQTIG